MEIGSFTLFFYLTFIWGSVGMLFIGVVVIKEMISMFSNKNKSKPFSNDYIDNTVFTDESHSNTNNDSGVVIK